MHDTYVTDEAHGNGWTLWLGDCCERLQELDENSVDLSVTSPPFSSLYVYSPSPRDLGNCRNDADFIEHYGYVIREQLRVTRPGRLAAVHVAQVPLRKGVDGVVGLKDFRGRVIEAFVEAGWVFHGEMTVDKNPQAQAIRTKSQALMFVQLERDSAMSRPALADYVILFRKPGDNAVPIKPEVTRDEWIEWARPVWYGIRETNTLNTKVAKDNDDERHIAPLQLDLIERCVRLWSNRGELVLSPFAGIGSEGVVSVRLGRRFHGIELKRAYFETAKVNLMSAEADANEGTLFAADAESS